MCKLSRHILYIKEGDFGNTISYVYKYFLGHKVLELIPRLTS